jgi:N-acetylglutamate synthase-like GNAT family acetyltransferase
MATIRPFHSSDFGLLLELANQAVPFAPDGNKEWLEYRKSFDEDKFFRYHCIAEENGKATGCGCLEQQSDDPARLRIFVVCHPEELGGKVGSRLFDHLLEKAKMTPATNLWAREYQRDQAAEKFFKERGFEEAIRLDLPHELPMVVYSLKIV